MVAEPSTEYTADMRRLAYVPIALLIIAFVPLFAQERSDENVSWKIRQEGTTRSSVLHSVHVLADRFSPRLTGAPGLKAAGEWAIEQMRAWGLQNGRLEPWDFNRPGWTNERLAAHIISPVKDALVVEALGWTPSTNGIVRGPAMGITPPQRATRAEYHTYLDTIKPRVARAMVLVGIPRQVPVTFNQPALRREDGDVTTQMAPAAPARSGGPALPPQQPPQQARGRGAGQPSAQGERPLTAAEMDNLLNEFLVANGALVRVNDAGRDHGQIRAFNNRTYDPAKSPPTVVMRNEDYGRIWRLLHGGPASRDDVRTLAASLAPVELEFEIFNRLHPEGRTSYNALAEIPGGDKADEVVILGAHLDAWHAGTGATDNAVGCAVMMEAARILTVIGVTPRRTIRVALWSGEEQGLYGSQAHVRDQFGTVEEPKPAFAKFAGYVNLDTGTGRVRGMTVFGPPEAAAILRQAMAPFADLGVIGATSTTSRTRGNSDHTSFNWAGLPGINLLQDPIEYSSYTWHTNLDTYERIVEDDVKKAAIVVAGLVYHLAMRDEPLPRLSREQMPRRPATSND